MPDLRRTAAWEFFQRSKLEPAGGGEKPAIEPAPAFKTYPQAERVLLPPPSWPAEASLQNALTNRRSRRKYKETPLAIEELATLLWATQGVTGRTSRLLLRTAPSAGALYALETYLVITSVSGIEQQIAHLHVADFCLETLATGNRRQELTEAMFGQQMGQRAAVTFVWTAVLRRIMSKYGERAMRYLLLDSGHVAQNLLLAAEALGLGACPIGAFYDDRMSRLLALDGVEEPVIYMATVGGVK